MWFVSINRCKIGFKSSLYPGYNIETFTSQKEFMEKIDYYLQNEDEREEIALRGFKEAIQKHTYENRLTRLITLIFSA